ncbi:MAG: protein kinase domain-containing protein [Solirubrobacteraceae bacterium]
MQTIAGRYELLDVLGRGGMGAVYRARDQLLERIVAVKVLPAEYADDPLLVERFEREARAAARLNHPNIVAVFDTGRDGTVRYIVMECVPGQSLAQLLNARGGLPVAQAVGIAAQVADALGVAHAAGIIHRDIKPGNVMVEPSGQCKVLDFGIARLAADAALTQTASLLGSAPYMPPEMSLGRTADARSDIYSLGCVLYEMLTDRPPFRGDVAAAIINQHVNLPPAPPSELNTSVPAGLDALVLRMLAKDPAARPQSGVETAAALRALLRDQPTAATIAAVPPVAPAPAPPVGPDPDWASDSEERRGGSSIVPVVLAVAAALVVGLVIALAASSGSGGPSPTTKSSASSATSSRHTSTSTPTSSSSSSSSSTPTSSSSTTSTSTPTSSSTTSSTSSSTSSSSPRSTTP